MYNIELSLTNNVFGEVIKEFTVMDGVWGDKYTDFTGMKNHVEMNTYFYFHNTSVTLQ